MADSCDVAIIGAGLSGVTAAYQLRDLDVVLLEAEDQIGGRSQRTEIGGWPATSGAEGWYDPNPDSPETRFLTEAGIKLSPVGGMGKLHTGRSVIGLAEIDELAEAIGLSEEARPDFAKTFGRVRDTCAALTRPPVEGLLRELLDTSGADWIGPVHDEVLRYYRRVATTEMGTSLETDSAFSLLAGMPAFGGASDVWMQFLVPDGGAPMISWALAEQLQRAPLTGAYVSSVENDESGAIVKYRHDRKDKSLHARYVIVATPHPVTTEIVRDLPSKKLAGMATVRVQPIVEVSLLLADGGPAPWDDFSAMWTIDKAFSVCLLSKTDHTNRVGDGEAGKHSVIKMIAVGPSAAPVADRTDDCVADAFVNDFIDMFPEARGKVRAHTVKRWMHGVPLPLLGFDKHIPELVKPVGNIHFAGDWCGFVDVANPGGVGVQGDWGGYGVTAGLNAAVRAGMRASAEIRERAERQ